MNKNEKQDKINANKIFSLELNVVSFISPVIIMLIFIFTKEANIGTLISTALTFAFTAYMLKLTRTYEQVDTDINAFLDTLIFPRKNEMKDYFIFTFGILIVNSFILGIALITFYGLELYAKPTIVKCVLGGYYVSLALIGSSYFSMLIIFDFIISVVLYMKIKFIKE
ncbi:MULTISPECIES: hypothetical protein [Bacilli]|uniref:hypothetical protein n=1 Tax=Bacilli TaxID=91061 RepID=UPI0002DC99FF|nr:MULTISPECIES: hypothetical protein [Bacilli]OLF30395.1 hypothetical protein BSZ11_12905 [Staphylococcus sp. 47.1]COT21226.1 Uncharacterised protein [Streptococcus pneumoniae]